MRLYAMKAIYNVMDYQAVNIKYILKHKLNHPSTLVS